MPPKSAFIPRSLLIDEGEFGQDPDALWRLATDIDEAIMLCRAREQHEYACVILTSLRPGDYSIADLADQLGQDRKWLWRKLAGKVPATENDLIRWAWLTGVARRTYPLDALTAFEVPGPRYPLVRRRTR